MSLESQHWYSRDGQPCHTQPTKGKDAKNPTRATTITDAKRLGLLPSVSGITKMLAAPGLDLYKQREVAKQCFLNPPHPGEEMDPYVAAMVDKGKEDGAAAADVGTLIHRALEEHFTGDTKTVETVVVNGTTYHVDTFIAPAIALIEERGWRIVASEKVLVNRAEGYAGTTDLLIERRDGICGVADFKSKRSKPGKLIEPVDTHPVQIAAYCMAHWKHLSYGANIYISTTEPGRVGIVEYGPEMLAKSWQAFLSMRDLWIWANNYDPRTHD